MKNLQFYQWGLAEITELQVENEIITHQIATTGGQSGSPIMI